MQTTALADVARARQMCRTGEAKHIRTSAGVSLRELGQDVGTSPSTVYRWEMGERMPRAESAVRLLRVLTALQQVA
jgi:transcriptional regulator with XRE-family HTH domain